MRLSPYHADDLNIFNSSEFPRELLNSPSHGEQYILVLGPDLVKWEEAHSHRRRHTYLRWLLEEMVVSGVFKRMLFNSRTSLMNFVHYSLTERLSRQDIKSKNI